MRLTALHPSRKCWLVLEAGQLTLHEERGRGEARAVSSHPLRGAAVRVAPVAKKGSKRQASVRGKASLISTALIHGNSEENVGMGKAGGAALKQPVVLTELAARGCHVFRVTWPGADVREQLVCGAPTPAERDAWAAALEKSIKTLAEAAPTKGYLMKRRGRHGGLKMMLGGWDRRYFELLQGKDGGAPSFSYYDDEHAAASKGVVALNAGAVLLASGSLAYKDHPHVLALTCKGELDAKPTTTVLAAASQPELERWVAALQRAIHSFRAPGSSSAKVVALSKEEEQLLAKTAPQLHLKLDYMGVPFDRRCEDKPKLVALILHQKQLNDIARAATPAARGELMSRIRKDEQRLLARSVDELRALLEYMEVELPPELADKQKLVALVINQKNFGATVQSVAPELLSWRQKSRSRASLVEPTDADAETEGGA